MQSYGGRQYPSLIWINSVNIIEILQSCPLFTEVSGESFGRLAAIGRICRFRKGEAIFRENDAPPGVYVVGEGLVRVFKTGPAGKEHVLHMAGPGDSFAEAAAIGGFPLPASADAAEKSVCAILPQDKFQRLLTRDHSLCLGLMSGLTVWVRRLVGLVEDIALRDATGRLARYLLELDKANDDATVRLPGMKRHVASHLNLTSETFSRTMRRLIEAGLIAEAGGTRVRIVHPRKLRQVAEGMFPKL